MTDPLYRHDACDTSIAAAESIDVTRLESIVLSLVRRAGEHGLTQDEALLAVCGELAYSSVTARFAGLTRKGLICDSGKRRKGRSGRSQRVHVATPKFDQTEFDEMTRKGAIAWSGVDPKDLRG